MFVSYKSGRNFVTNSQLYDHLIPQDYASKSHQI